MTTSHLIDRRRWHAKDRRRDGTNKFMCQAEAIRKDWSL